jgi:hypothetical protein
MSDFSIIVEHPQYQEIITKLLSGESPKSINQWLRLKYADSNQSHLRIPVKALRAFADSEYCNIENQLLKDLANVESGNKLDKKIAASLVNNKTYQERLAEVADKEIDVKSMLVGLINVCQSRAEQIFDKIQENPGSFKGDYVFIKYMTELFLAVERFEKLINRGADMTIQHNVSVQAIDQYTVILQETIRDVLMEMNPELAGIFLDKLYERLKKTGLPAPIIPLTAEEKLKEVTILQEKVLSVDKES